MKAVIFDLDNTLYDASKYYLGAFKEIAHYLSKKSKVTEEKIYKKLVTLWKEKTSMYPHLFDDLLESLDLKNELESIVKKFNSYDGKITPYPDAIPTLKELKKRDYKLGIITDGDVERQKRKIKKLQLDEFFETIVFSKELKSPKPSTAPFQKAVDTLGVRAEECFYVGDNPLIDFEGAKKTHIRTVRLLKGEFKNIPKNEYIDYQISELKELLEVIKND